MIASGRLARALPRFFRLGAVSLLALALGASAAGAQGASPGGSTPEDVVARDSLIAAQETLLNFFRCQFGLDVEAVPGGCADGYPTRGFSPPGEFEGIPSAEDIAVRDRLVAVQEALLNTYRCRYGVDIHAVAGGCQQFAPAERTARPAADLLTAAEAVAEGGLPRGLVTPSGVTVAVAGRDGDGYRVVTPCGNNATVSKGRPLRNVRVVIDPGHGGASDSGPYGPNGLVEKNLNLTLSRAVLGELASRGITASTTRTGDYDTLLSVRAGFADALGAEALVSLHHNAPTFATGSVPGTEVFVQSASRQVARADSARLGGLLYAEITEALSRFKGVRWSRLSDAGVLRVLVPDGRDAYGMIRRPNLPATLVEYGYLSNPSEAALFATDEYIAVAAKATANAIEAYLNTDRSGAEVRSPPRVFTPQRAPSRCTEVELE
ncbi:MAG: N-acetylmuramoyl-L-alanine amidase [bacterium]|nr:N-acetylmuramoyl-L-alanine amidase [bacterium]